MKRGSPPIAPQTLTSIPLCACGLDHHGDQAKHGRIGGGVEFGDGLVGPVHGQRVLNQVIGSY